MKSLFMATAALTLSGSALAYQNTQVQDDMPTTTTMTATHDVTLDPTMALSPPADWNDQQRTLYQQHITTYPIAWTVPQRTMFQQQLTLPPAQWTAEQRALWQQHMASLPTTWTEQQRAMYQQQVANWRTPWIAHQTAMAPAGDRIVEPSNANPERDARGIRVISAAVVVPAGYNGLSATALGGPLEDAEGSYPPCTASVTDNCIQLYERGVRASLASWDRPPGGLDRNATGVGGPLEEVKDNTPEDDGLDVDTKPDGTLDIDGDLDGDGDNDLE